MTRTRTDEGTIVEIVRRDGEEIVLLSSIHDADTVEAGRIFRADDGDAGFQPAPFAPFALRPAVLRTIADMIEGVTR